MFHLVSFRVYLVLSVLSRYVCSLKNDVYKIDIIIYEPLLFTVLIIVLIDGNFNGIPLFESKYPYVNVSVYEKKFLDEAK